MTSDFEFEPAVPGLAVCPHCGQTPEMRLLDTSSGYRICCACPWTVEAPVHSPVAALDSIKTAWNQRAEPEPRFGKGARIRYLGLAYEVLDIDYAYLLRRIGGPIQSDTLRLPHEKEDEMDADW